MIISSWGNSSELLW